MNKKKPKAVVDTNLLVSGLISPHRTPFKIIKAWRKKRFDLVTSPQILQEFEEVLRRPKLAKYGISNKKVLILIERFAKSAKQVIPAKKSTIRVRDPKDEHILAAAIDSHADYLVTGDNDLLSLRNHQQIRPLAIITAKHFLEILKNDEDT